jgi:hypothetical protein
VAGAVAGGIVGVAAARLRGPYLAGATLMLAVALPSLADKYSGLLGGDQGLSFNITTPAFLGAAFPPTRWLAWIACIGALVTLILLANLGRSRIGRSWRALRDNEVAASLAGLNVARMQILAFVVSSACAGLGGALLAAVSAIVSPGAFTLSNSELRAGSFDYRFAWFVIWGSLPIVIIGFPNPGGDTLTVTRGIDSGIAPPNTFTAARPTAMPPRIEPKSVCSAPAARMAPTMMTEEIALVTDMSGVCSAGVTFQMT